MRGSFWRPLTPRLSPYRPPWRFAVHAACLSALGVACVLVGVCGQVTPPKASASVQPTRADPTASCDGMRQLLTSHNAAPTPTMPPGGHWAYTIQELGPLPRQTTWPAGATLRFSFCAMRAQTTTDPQAQAERITTQLLGPFATLAAASQAMNALNTQAQAASNSTPTASATPGPVAVSAPTLTTNTLAGVDVSTTLKLPTTPRTGYYVYVTRVASPGAGTRVEDESFGIIQLQVA